MDRFAYDERCAIMAADGSWGLKASRDAAEAAYSTRMSCVCTAAANDDWEPAQAWCEEIGARFGAAAAADVMLDIWDNIKGEFEWKQLPLPKPPVRLRLVVYTNVRQQRRSVFVALTDAEFQTITGSSEQRSLAPFKARILSVVPDVEPSDDQRRAAMAAFALRFGSAGSLPHAPL